MVPTPVGNLEDMTFRAIKVLKESDLILAEDTRTTGKLTSHYDIATPKQALLGIGVILLGVPLYFYWNRNRSEKRIDF